MNNKSIFIDSSFYLLNIFFKYLVEYGLHAQSMDHGQSGETDDEGIERDSAECEEISRTNFATFDDVLEVNIICIT